MSKNALYNHPAFLAFRSAKGAEKNEDTNASEPVKQVTVKEEGKANSFTVKNEE